MEKKWDLVIVKAKKETGMRAINLLFHPFVMRWEKDGVISAFGKRLYW